MSRLLASGYFMSLLLRTHRQHYGIASSARSRAELVVHLPPFAAEALKDGDVCDILLKAGDPVRQDEVVVSIETDKTTVNVQAPCNGHIGTIYVAEGDTVRPGDKMFSIKH